MYKPRHRKLSEHLMPQKGEGTEMMGEERDTWSDGPDVQIGWSHGLVFGGYGMLSLVSFLNESFLGTVWFELFT